MGVIALGIGFGTPLALAGVAVHIVGHARQGTRFYAATPLLGTSRARPAIRPAASVAPGPRSPPARALLPRRAAGLPPRRRS